MKVKSTKKTANSKALIGKNISEANKEVTKDVAKSICWTMLMMIVFNTITKKDIKLIIHDYTKKGEKCQLKLWG